MKARTMLGVMGLVAGGMLAAVLLLPTGAVAGEYHVGGQLICSDCHTIHYSQQHQYDGTAGQGQPPLTGGPNHYLLRQPANQLCQGCHNGQAFAPDVLGTNANASPSEGREAGALNEAALGAPYDVWKGHTLESHDAPPGYNPSLVGLGDWYTGTTTGLECLSCHLNHGIATSYRNLGPRSLGSAPGPNFRPSYVISTTNDTTKDVWVNIPTGYVAGTGSAATFNPYYDRANIFFNRNDATVGTVKTSNKVGSFCAACHASFHGGPSDTNIGGTGTPATEFLRHPTSQVTIGAVGGGHSNLARYVAATNKVKVLTNDYTAYTNSSPGCISCHKAHGNQNPFGLILMARLSGTISEEGTTTDVKVGIRNLCGQCHVQGN